MSHYAVDGRVDAADLDLDTVHRWLSERPPGRSFAPLTHPGSWLARSYRRDD